MNLNLLIIINIQSNMLRQCHIIKFLNILKQKHLHEFYPEP
jgi:hypothetical protein